MRQAQENWFLFSWYLIEIGVSFSIKKGIIRSKVSPKQNRIILGTQLRLP